MLLSQTFYQTLGNAEPSTWRGQSWLVFVAGGDFSAWSTPTPCPARFLSHKGWGGGFGSRRVANSEGVILLRARENVKTRSDGPCQDVRTYAAPPVCIHETIEGIVGETAQTKPDYDECEALPPGSVYRSKSLECKVPPLVWWPHQPSFCSFCSFLASSMVLYNPLCFFNTRRNMCEIARL